MEVDAAIVIALDVSHSIDGPEFSLMRTALAAVLAGDAVAEAIATAPLGAVDFTLVQWSGSGEQVTSINWHRAQERQSLAELAQRVEAMPRRFVGGATHIFGAVSYARQLLKSRVGRSRRLVINLVGDGPNNINSLKDSERMKAVKADITINALVIDEQAPKLTNYYRRWIVSGEDSFAETITRYDDFAAAMERKLVREIAGILLY